MTSEARKLRASTRVTVRALSGLEGGTSSPYWVVLQGSCFIDCLKETKCCVKGEAEAAAMLKTT